MEVEIKDNRKEKPKGIAWLSNHVYRAHTYDGKEVIVIIQDDEDYVAIFENNGLINMDKDDFNTDGYVLSEDITAKVKIIFEIS